jgi:hypothetical protein
VKTNITYEFVKATQQDQQFNRWGQTRESQVFLARSPKGCVYVAEMVLKDLEGRYTILIFSTWQTKHEKL